MKEYRSAIRSRELIRNAVCELTKEKAVDKITVSDIVNSANINRSTFYAHYQDIFALYDEIENEILEEMYDLLGKFDYHHFFEEPFPLFLELCKFLELKLDYYKTLANSSRGDAFFDRVKYLFEEYMLAASNTPTEIRSSKSFAARTCFFVGGFINLLKKWFSDEIAMSAEELAKEFSELMRK